MTHNLWVSRRKWVWFWRTEYSNDVRNRVTKVQDQFSTLVPLDEVFILNVSFSYSNGLCKAYFTRYIGSENSGHRNQIVIPSMLAVLSMFSGVPAIWKNRIKIYFFMCTMCRRDKLYQETEARRKRLAESLEMHQFLQDIYEVGSWISEKTQIASDESFRDESNLTHKLQKHQAFEAELLSNRGRVDSVQQVCRSSTILSPASWTRICIFKENVVK